jgi:hypothetical protein
MAMIHELGEKADKESLLSQDSLTIHHSTFPFALGQTMSHFVDAATEPLTYPVLPLSGVFF